MNHKLFALRVIKFVCTILSNRTVCEGIKTYETTGKKKNLNTLYKIDVKSDKLTKHENKINKGLLTVYTLFK